MKSTRLPDVDRNLIIKLLTELAGELNVPSSKYEEAKARYKAVGDWLSAPGSALTTYNPEVYPQGSFALGTAVRPLHEDEYDIDAVCLLHVDWRNTTQEQVKNIVGHRLREHGRYKDMLDPEEGGRRCWTLKWADETRFHMDILPAVPDPAAAMEARGVPSEYTDTGLCITDTRTYGDRDWPKSNPKGYAKWFRGKMKVIFEERRRFIARARYAGDVEQVPEYEVQTPLQFVVQLLKRHRDVTLGDNEDKPISIIITTLAGQAYDGEENVLDALLNMIPKMRNGVTRKHGEWWIANPVSPEENFADKWSEERQKSVVFFQWLESVENLHRALLTERDIARRNNMLAEAYGARDAATAMRRLGIEKGITRPVRSEFDVRHRQIPEWKMDIQYDVKVTAKARQRPGFRDIAVRNNQPSIDKHYKLEFSAKTNAPGDITVKWQVVNTGSEAANNNGLRGGFYSGDNSRGTRREERTLYAGKHWVEAFVIKDGVCVARSGEFVVNVV